MAPLFGIESPFRQDMLIIEYLRPLIEKAVIAKWWQNIHPYTLVIPIPSPIIQSLIEGRTLKLPAVEAHNTYVFAMKISWARDQFFDRHLKQVFRRRARRIGQAKWTLRNEPQRGKSYGQN